MIILIKGRSYRLVPVLAAGEELSIKQLARLERGIAASEMTTARTLPELLSEVRDMAELEASEQRQHPAYLFVMIVSYWLAMTVAGEVVEVSDCEDLRPSDVRYVSEDDEEGEVPGEARASGRVGRVPQDRKPSRRAKPKTN